MNAIFSLQDKKKSARRSSALVSSQREMLSLGYSCENECATAILLYFPFFFASS